MFSTTSFRSNAFVLPAMAIVCLSGLAHADKVCVNGSIGSYQFSACVIGDGDAQWFTFADNLGTDIHCSSISDLE